MIETLDDFDRSGSVVITEKMDGECTTLRRDGIHARSLDYMPHPSRTRARALHARIAHEIPEGWRVVGENCYAKHSIHYRDLPAYFMVFSIWRDDICLSWKETKEWCELLDLVTVPELVEPAQWYEDWTKGVLTDKVMQKPDREGYVVRIARAFKAIYFQRCVGKYVRADHVQTDEHWMWQEVIPNELRSDGRRDGSVVE